MKEKKNAVITFRTEEWVKNLLERAAEENKWSVAQTVNELCKKFVANPQPERITISASELKRVAREIEQEGIKTGIEITIEPVVNEDETNIIKTLNFTLLKCGGIINIEGPEPIKEMSREEIIKIP